MKDPQLLPVPLGKSLPQLELVMAFRSEREAVSVSRKKVDPLRWFFRVLCQTSLSLFHLFCLYQLWVLFVQRVSSTLLFVQSKLLLLFASEMCSFHTKKKNKHYRSLSCVSERMLFVLH